MKKQVLHEKNEFENVRYLVEFTGERYADRTAYSYRTKASDKEIQKVTFSKLRDDVRALASELISMGVAGKHCVVVGKMSYDWALVYFSVLSAGGVIVPLDRDWAAEDLTDTAVKANVAFLFCEEDLKEKADAIAAAAQLEAPVTYISAKTDERPLSLLV